MWDLAEACLAAAAFAVLCVLVLRAAPYLPEPDDNAYRASIVAMTDGHFFTLWGSQAHALAVQLAPQLGGSRLSPGPGGGPVQWVQLPGGRWISEKDPGYPYLAVAFQALGLIRLAPLFYAALACLGLYVGGRRWLGRFGGAAAVGLYCSSGAAILFAWRDYMPTFTEASLIAAGTGALLWVVLAAEASARRRTCVGLAGFVALEAATFSRYTNIVVLGCAVIAVLIAWRLRAARLPGALGAISLLGAWLLVRVPRGQPLAAITTLVVVAALFGLGGWAFHDMYQFPFGPSPGPGGTVELKPGPGVIIGGPGRVAPGGPLATSCGNGGQDQNRWKSGWSSCQNVSTTLPIMLGPSIGPQYRLSHESARLSPSM